MRNYLLVVVRYTYMASRSFRSNAVMFTVVLAIQLLTVTTEMSQHDRFTLRDENATNQTNSTTSSDDESLSADAIANIAATGAAIGIIASITCYMCYCYNHRERMQRIRTAIERNRVIRARIAAEKAAAAASTQPNTTADNQTTSDINVTSTESTSR